MRIGQEHDLSWLGKKNSEPGVYSLISAKLPPYDHQRRAVSEAVGNMMSHGFHALFMEMGTGKTKVTIDSWMVMVAKGISDCLLVVCPKSLMSTWELEEIPKHLSIRASVGRWDGKTTDKGQREFDTIVSSQGNVIYIVNVEAFQVLNETLRLRVSRLLRGRKVMMVADESSTLKGPDAKRSKNVKAAGTLAKVRLILTGTEISKSPLDLYMQFEFLQGGFWGTRSFFMFRQKYAILEDSYGAGGRSFKKIVGYQKINELVDSIAPYTTRVLKKDCLDLPEKIRAVIRVEMTPAQVKVYSELKKFMATMLGSGEVMTVPNKIALFTKFRQITGGTLKDGEQHIVIEPSPGKLMALLADIEDTDEQAIVWCAFRGEIDIVSKALAQYGEVVTFDGSTDIEERDEAKLAFQEGRKRFFVANMKTGAYGLNLQNCHLQYFYSRDLSPQANWQAEDRSHRPGQRSPCVYKSLVCSGTVDERVEELIAKSADLRDMLREMSVPDMISMV
jgi:SNF2 family DNA or RNA helicase